MKPMEFGLIYIKVFAFSNQSNQIEPISNEVMKIEQPALVLNSNEVEPITGFTKFLME